MFHEATQYHFPAVLERECYAFHFINFDQGDTRVNYRFISSEMSV